MGRSKLRDDILKLRGEGKTYKEVSDILKCSETVIAYHTSSPEKMKVRKQKMRVYRDSGRAKNRRDSYNQRNRDYISEYLKSHPCVDCGNHDIRVLEFDHVRGKKLGNIANAAQKAWSMEKLLAEIDKCEVRCANCHRIVTFERRKHSLKISSDGQNR